MVMGRHKGIRGELFLSAMHLHVVVPSLNTDAPRIQPNPVTQQHQLALWSELVLAWARHDRVFAVNAESPDPGDIFANKAIGREC